MEKQPFYLTKRKLPSGKSIYYFYTYDKYGNRTTPQSTGLSKKSEAMLYCTNLLIKHSLNQSSINFKDYANDFFEKSNKWYKLKSASKAPKDSTLTIYKINLNRAIEFFGTAPLAKITTVDILEFISYLRDKEFSAKTINANINVLRIIFNFAVSDDVIYKSPINKMVSKLEEDEKREAYTFDEVKYLIKSHWVEYDYFLISLTAAITGMRISEILVLQEDQIKDGYINVNQQYYRSKITSVKTSENRFVTIPKRLEEMLLENGKGKNFIFNSKDPFKPLSYGNARIKLSEMFSQEMRLQKDERGLGYHSYRYFVNTLLISRDVSPQKVNFIIGHSDGVGVMQKLYTTWRPEMYADVLKIQTELLDELLADNPNLKK